MALPIVYSIQPNPHWVIINNFSKLPDGAAIYTYRSLDPSTFKPAFVDAGGTVQYGQPITGFGNGTMPPIFWEFDPNNPTDTYYIRVYDSADPVTQQFLWDFNGLSGAGGGGGGTIVTASNIENQVVNNIFFRNIGQQLGTPSLPTSLTIAPSNNAGFVNDLANVNVTNNGPVGPDIIFAKNNTTSSDKLNFVTFTPLGINSLIGDVTPVVYLNYQCTGAGAGETYKYVQFPISQGVQSLSQQTVTVRIYARCNSGDTTLTLKWRQFYGSGGAPSADQIVNVGASLTLNNTWQVFTIPSQVPDATGKTLGNCLNDALFLEIWYPLAPALTNIDFIKPAIYLGNIPMPGVDFVSNDEVDSIVNSPRTGDTRTSLNSFLLGWVQMNDGTIGNKDGGGDSLATARDNVDTFPLFSLIWNTFVGSQTLAPMFTSAGVPVAYGADAVTDFTAYRQLSLTRNLGRVMAGALPVSVSQAFTNVGNVMTVSSTASFFTGVPVTVSGGGLPTPLVAGTTYYAIQLSLTTLSLASSAANAIAGTPIALTSNASGTVTVPSHALGFFNGEETHFQTVNELASHHHNAPAGQNFLISGGGSLTGAGPNAAQAPSGTTTDTPLANVQVAFNVMQLTVFMNVFVKL